MALAKSADAMCGWLRGEKVGLKLNPTTDSATVWHAWQAGQVSQCALAGSAFPSLL
jgi:hypothetical protein